MHRISDQTWPKLASLAQKTSFISLVHSLLPKDNLFKNNIFDFTTAADWDCVAAVEHLPFTTV